MKRSNARLLLAASAPILILAGFTPASADAPKNKEGESDTKDVIVTGIVGPATSASATGLPLSLMDTPQSVTVIDHQRIQDFALTDTAQVLDQVVGINVERGETDRTTFDARGFDVTNFQVDGVGLPLISGLVYGETDSFLYDRIEIVRGADGLATGVGNPSATIDYIRKRPLDGLHAYAAAYGGSYDMWRVEGDVSAPINGAINVRLIGAHEERNSYLDHYSLNRDVFGIVAAGQISPDLKLTAGYSRQENDTHGSSWGSLTQFYSDGSRIPYNRSANAAPRWAAWPVRDQQAFAELAYAPGRWTVKAVANYSRLQQSPTIAYPYGYPDRATGEGYIGYAGDYTSDHQRYYGDLYAGGPVALFGREHQLTMGLSYAHSHDKEWEALGVSDIYPAYLGYPNFNSPDRFSPIEPTYGPAVLQQDSTDKLLRAYAASQINLADRLKAVIGASFARLETSGVNYGNDAARKNTKLNPYIGLLFDVASHVTVYGSYTKIFNPQSEVDINHARLGPIDGTNLEAGIKSEWFEKRLYATAAIFQTRQKGLASYAGDVVTPDFYSYYVGMDTTAKGFEFELAGRITDQLRVSGGYTSLSLKDEDGKAARTFIPRRTLKASSSYTIPSLHNFSLGAQMRRQSLTYADVLDLVDATGNLARLRQRGYAVVDLMAGLDVLAHLRATVNVRNVADKFYLNSLNSGSSGQAYFAAGRNFTASLAYKF